MFGLTGTPGTGKSRVARILSRLGWSVVTLDDLLRTGPERFVIRRDPVRRSLEVNLPAIGRQVDALRDRVAAPVVLVSHLAHLLPVDAAVVLRCRPSVLRRRLTRRGWSRQKIDENVEAEILDIILWEAVHRLGKALVGELGTNGRRPTQVARDVAAFARGERRRFRPGRYDWSGDLLRRRRAPRHR